MWFCPLGNSECREQHMPLIWFLSVHRSDLNRTNCIWSANFLAFIERDVNSLSCIPVFHWVANVHWLSVNFTSRKTALVTFSQFRMGSSSGKKKLFLLPCAVTSSIFRHSLSPISVQHFNKHFNFVLILYEVTYLRGHATVFFNISLFVSLHEPPTQTFLGLSRAWQA